MVRGPYWNCITVFLFIILGEHIFALVRQSAAVIQLQILIQIKFINPRMDYTETCFRLKMMNMIINNLIHDDPKHSIGL